MEVDARGGRRSRTLQGGASVVLAPSAVENTRLALHPFPTPLMGGGRGVGGRRLPGLEAGLNRRASTGPCGHWSSNAENTAS